MARPGKEGPADKLKHAMQSFLFEPADGEEPHDGHGAAAKEKRRTTGTAGPTKARASSPSTERRRATHRPYPRNQTPQAAFEKAA